MHKQLFIATTLLPQLIRVRQYCYAFVFSFNNLYSLFVATYSMQSLKHLNYFCAMHFYLLVVLVFWQLRAHSISLLWTGGGREHGGNMTNYVKFLILFFGKMSNIQLLK